MAKANLQVIAVFRWHLLVFLVAVFAAIERTTARIPGSGSFVSRPAFAAIGRPSHRMNQNGSNIITKLGVLVDPAQLLEIIDSNASTNALWNSCLRQRLSSSVASEGLWVANHDTGIESVFDIEIPKPGRGRIRLFCRDPSDDKSSETAVGLANAAVHLVFGDKSKSKSNKPRNVAVVTFAALDRRLLEKIGASLRDNYTVKSSWEYPCGMWIRDADAIRDTVGKTADLPETATLRPLTGADAELIESRWEYRSEDSLSMIQKMIAASESTFGGCFGMEIDGKLVAWVCRYLDGTLGMLWTEEDHRRKGYSIHVMTAAVQSINQRHDAQLTKTATNSSRPPLIAFTVDTNDASRGLLAKLGWKRLADADWAGFTLVGPD